MIDTLKLISPNITESVALEIERLLRTRTLVENSTGEVVAEFVAGSLEGSFDHRVRVELRRSEVCSIPALLTRSGRPEFYEQECLRVILEGSVHKAMLGYNIEGGPECPKAAARWFVDYVGKCAGVELPAADEWLVQRVDVAECFDLGSYEACQEFIQTLSQAKFPRRKSHKYGAETVAFGGTTTTWKVYHKGPEFSKHDHKRLLGVPGLCHDVLDLQQRANGILRVETSIKVKKLTADHGGKPTVAQLTREYVEGVHDVETTRVLRESEVDVTTVRRNTDVKRRLYTFYDGRLAGVLYGTWLALCAVGEDEVRRDMKRRTFYLHRKQLQDAGVSWFGSDVQVIDSAIPEGFSLRRSDPRRLSGEAPEVRRALLPFRDVA